MSIYTPESNARLHKLTLKQYINQKIRILQRDFKVYLTDEQMDHMKSLTSEIQVDNYAHTLLGM